MKKLLLVSLILLTCLLAVNVTFSLGEELVCPDGRTIDTDMVHEYYAASDFPDKYMKFFCSLPCDEAPFPSPMNDWPGFYMGLSSPTGHCAADSTTFSYVIDSQNRLVVLIQYDQQTMQHELLWVSNETPDGLGEYLQDIIRQSNDYIRGQMET